MPDFFNSAGQRRVEVTFETPALAPRDSRYNTPSTNWIAVGTVPGWVQDTLPSRAERLAEDIALAARPCRLRVRWGLTIGPQMRVLIDGRRHAIVAGPAELGRQQGWEMLCEELTTVGDQP